MKMSSDSLRWIIEVEMQNDLNRALGLTAIAQPVIVENTETGEEEIFF